MLLWETLYSVKTNQGSTAMKKLFTYIAIITYLFSFYPLAAYAMNKTQIATISKIENNLFGFDYTNDSEQNRITRLEKTIYGEPSAGNLNKRLEKLSADILAEQIGLEIKPVEDTFREEEDSIAQADSTVNYPVVDEIEQKLFNKTYKNRDFHTRIVTIERKLFGKIYDVDDYATRMDRIKAEVMPQTLARKEDNFDYGDNALSSVDLGAFGRNRFGTMPYGQESYTRPYANYGDAQPPKYSPNELNDELAQLEYDMFGTEFSNEDTQSRIRRLNSVNKAKRSSHRYDSMQFSQRMSTAMEIGAMILMILAMVL